MSSFLLVEFQSIAVGYKKMNNIILNYPVTLFLCKNICPGRILFIFKGTDHDVLEIKEYLETEKISSIDILNINDEIIMRMNNTKVFPKFSSLMICEFKNSISAIKASDLCLKSSNIELMKISFHIGLFGKSIAIFGGTISSLNASKNIIIKNFSNKHIIAIEIIENPVGDLIKCI